MALALNPLFGATQAQVPDAAWVYYTSKNHFMALYPWAPSRGFQSCEALRTASSFGWYVFPPLDFTLQWDGSQILWTYRGAKAWYPLTSAQFPGAASRPHS